MKSILLFIKNRPDFIFFSLIFYGLSFSILIKEYLIIFIPSYKIPILEFYRFLIIIISIYCLYSIKKTLNKNIVLLVILSICFLHNSIFGEKISFNINVENFYLDNLNINIKNSDVFFLEKYKNIIVNLFNIILPLTILVFTKISQFNLSDFKKISIKICDKFFILLLVLLTYKYYLILYGFNKTIEQTISNLHGLIYFLDIYFLLIIDKISLKKDGVIKDIFKIILIFYCFFITNSVAHILICFLTFILYLTVFKLSKPIKNLTLFLFLIIFLSNVFYFSSLNLEIIKDAFDYKAQGTIMHSLISRFKHVEYFLFFSENQNILIGNNIFVENIYTYPHNLFIDIFLTTGIIGIIIFLYLIISLVFLAKKKMKLENFFMLTLFIQSFVFSTLSGFFFTNIILNISFAVCLCILNEKDLNIK